VCCHVLFLSSLQPPRVDTSVLRSPQRGSVAMNGSDSNNSPNASQVSGRRAILGNHSYSGANSPMASIRSAFTRGAGGVFSSSPVHDTSARGSVIGSVSATSTALPSASPSPSAASTPRNQYSSSSINKQSNSRYSYDRQQSSSVVNGAAGVADSAAAGATVKSSAYTARDSAVSPTSNDAKSAAAAAAVALLEKPHSVAAAAGGGTVPRVVSAAMYLQQVVLQCAV
jgi:hypothetical protein